MRTFHSLSPTFLDPECPHNCLMNPLTWLDQPAVFSSEQDTNTNFKVDYIFLAASEASRKWWKPAGNTY